jgi:hypothetical protein
MQGKNYFPQVWHILKVKKDEYAIGIANMNTMKF